MKTRIKVMLCLVVFISLFAIFFMFSVGFRHTIYFIALSNKTIKPILILDSIDISKEGAAVEVPFKNKYYIPMEIKYVLTERNDNIPDANTLLFNSQKITLNMRIKVELLVENEVCYQFHKENISLNGLIEVPSGKKKVYLWIGRLDYPLAAYISSNKSIRITVESTDEKLRGSKGVFVVVPDISE